MHEVLQAIAESIAAGKTAVFFGAGLSKNSGMPLVKPLVSAILDRLPILRRERASLFTGRDEVDEDDKDEQGDQGNLALPFELFMESMIDATASTRLCDIYRGGKPNKNHILLARLAKERKVRTIVTTNFDTLLEQALDDEGMIEEHDYDVLIHERQFHAIYDDSGKVRLIKIHGCVTDIRSIAITLTQVAARIRSGPRAMVMRYLFRDGEHQNVLMLGYSCSDIFDLTPEIEAARDSTKVIYLLQEHDRKWQPLTRDEAGRVMCPLVTRIRQHTERNPFSKYTAGYRIFCRTDAAVRLMWRYWQKRQWVSSNKSQQNWHAIVDCWYDESQRRYGDSQAAIVAGYLFLNTGNYAVAERHFRSALEKSVASGNRNSEQMCRANLGTICRGRRRFHEALEHFTRAADLSLGTSAIDTTLSLRRSMAGVQRELGNDKAAETLYMGIIESPGDPAVELIAGCYGGLGNLYRDKGRYDDAKRCYEHAAKLARDCGDVRGDAIWTASVGNILCDQEEYGLAFPYLRNALELAEQVGDVFTQGHIHNNLGNIYLLYHDRKATYHYQVAISVLEPMLDPQDRFVAELYEKLEKSRQLTALSSISR